MLVSFKLFRPDDRDLGAFIRLMTDNHYKIMFERNGTKHLMARVELTDAQIRACEPTDVSDTDIQEGYNKTNSGYQE